METRVYTCPIIGTGAEDDPYRPKVTDYPCVLSWSADIRSDAAGHPLDARCVVEIEAEDHSPLLADPELEEL